MVISREQRDSQPVTDCIACQDHRRAGATFCSACGARLGNVCAQCKSSLAVGAKFCAECGSPAEARESVIAEGERRHLTVLFCDLANSTTVAAGLDPEDWGEVLVNFQAEVSRVIGDAGGYVAQFLGDGLLAYFGYPVASEHEAERATRCGLKLVEALQALNPKLRSICGVELKLRVGIHAGPVVVSTVGSGARKETLALGSTANIAARIQAAALPDNVMISDAVMRAIGRAFVTQDCGEHQLKGIAAPMRLHAVTRAKRRSRSFIGTHIKLTPFVGRQTEIAVLSRAITSVDSGRGKVVLLSGEAGSGKSRLVHETRRALAEPRPVWLELRADAEHRDSPLFPVREMQRELLDLSADAGTEEDLRRMQEALSRAGFELEQALPLLASLHGFSLPAPFVAPALTPLGLHKQTLALLVEWMLRLARERTVVLLVEDLHWLDPSSVELLARLSSRVAEARLLVLITTRPEFTVNWADSEQVEKLQLERFDVQTTDQLIRGSAMGRALPESTVRAISLRSAGIPYFAEELASVVLGAAATPESNPAVWMPLPETLADSLAARLDGVGSAKEVVQLASVIGLEFSYALLQTLWRGTTVELVTSLERAERMGLVSSAEQGDSRSYFFCHTLFREAAYDSLLKRVRRRYHLAIAESLLHNFEERAKLEPELLARHFELAENPARAIEYWQRAAHRALERGAIEEALVHLRCASRLLEKFPDPRTELDVMQTLARTLVVGRGWAHEETKAAWERAAALCDADSEPLRWGAIACGLGDVYSSLDLPESLARFEQLVQLGAKVDQPLLVIAGHQGAALALYYMGRIVEARAHLDAGLALYDPQRHRFFDAGFHEEKGVNLLCWSAWVHGLLGCPAQGLAEVERAIALAKGFNNSFAVAFATNWAACHELYSRHWVEAKSLGQAAAALSSEQGFVAIESLAKMAHAIAAGILGEEPNAAQLFMIEMSKFGGTGNRLGGTILLSLLADLQLSSGEHQAALATTEMGIGLAQATGQACFSAWLFALRARALDALAQANGQSECPPEVEALLLQALEIARAQEVRAFEVRAGIPLFELFSRSGRTVEARQALERVIERFPEQDSDFLHEARTLLERAG